jgi:PmbA protein
MMLNEIVKALNGRADLAGWTVKEIRSRGAQLYAVPQAVEADRLVDSEKYKVNLYCAGRAADGSETMGSGEVTILPGGDIGSALNQAALVAGLVANPVYSLPGPAPLPDVDIVDPGLKADPQGAMQDLMESMTRTGRRIAGVRMTAAEAFGDVIHTRLINSRGVDVEQESTLTSLEFVLHASQDGREVESFEEMTRRRPADLHVEEAIEASARRTLDQLNASAAPDWQGPVVLRGQTLAVFMAGDDLFGGVLQFLGSAAAKYAKYTPWEVGKSVFRAEVKGDALNLWANRLLPFGTTSDRFDAEGIPAQRLEFIQNNNLVSFAASQKYADYLSLPATGEFGAVESAPGTTPAADLLNEPYVEIEQFSWFNPDGITGDFATEVRLGYLVENGQRKPFRGGQLIGNYLDALANVRYSKETGFFGSYLGPHTARFEGLKLAGE